MPHVPHTLDAQLAHLEGLFRKRRQEQLANDQSDTDFALNNDVPNDFNRRADQRSSGFRVSLEDSIMEESGK